MRNSKIFPKVVSLLMVVSLVLLFFNKQEVHAYNYGTITENTYAVVTKVFDGESFEAKSSNGTYYLIKMIGVNAKAYDASYDYTYNRLMGKTVLLTLDRAVYSPVGRWNYCYVRENNEVINTKLIAMGYGEATSSTSNSTIFTEYSYIEEDAKSQNLGMWGETGIDGITYGGYDYTDDTININTASKSQIMEKLYDVDATLANEIVSYRRYNPFNKISDIKFVDGMTKQIYDKNVDRMHVVTDVNRAKAYELSTLSRISSSQADDIIEYRDKKKTIKIDDLLDDDILTDAQYDANEQFITDNDDSRIVYAISNYTANINTATSKQLQSAGLSNTLAQNVVDLREYGFTFKSVGELRNSDKINLSDAATRRLLDNIKAFTDINYSNSYEIKSLFGDTNSSMNSVIANIIDDREYRNIEEVKNVLSISDYQEIKPYIYVDRHSSKYINLNTATLEQLLTAGIDTDTARLIVAKRKNGIIKDYYSLPNNNKLKSFDDSISLFTNINDTSVLELTSLSTQMSKTFAQSIIDYTKDQPFGSMQEFSKFCNQNNMGNMYDEIEDYIVLY